MKTIVKPRVLISVLLMAVMMILPVQFPALAAGEPYRVEKDGFVYEVWTDGSNELHSVFVVEYKGSSKVVELPKPQSLVINGKTYPAKDGITSFIAGNGSQSVFPSNNVTKVAIPKGYEAVSEKAFNGCSALTEIAVAGSVGYVGSDAFAGCTNLTNYYLETNPYLSTDASSNPRIAQSTGGAFNTKQVTVYTKSDNSNVINYINSTNAARKAGEPEIIIKFVGDPYSMSTVPSGSGSESSSGSTDGGSKGAPAEQKGKDSTAIGKGASESAAEQFIVKYSTEADPAGSVFSALQLKAAKVTKSSVKLSWKKPAGAVRFVIYGNKCGKGNRYNKLTKTSASSIVIKKIGKNKVKKGAYYKFIVVALDKNGKVVSTSKTVHAATLGGKVGNAKALKTNAKKNKVSIKAKKSFKIKAKATPASKKLKVKKHRAILYESSNTKVATVNKKGVIKGVKKGKCEVYVYAQNGICRKIKVTVK